MKLPTWGPTKEWSSKADLSCSGCINPYMKLYACECSPCCYFCIAPDQKDHHPVYHEPSRGELRIMWYNVENLFHPDNDTIPGDDEFTPEGVRHWTYDRYQKKLTRHGQSDHCCRSSGILPIWLDCVRWKMQWCWRTWSRIQSWNHTITGLSTERAPINGGWMWHVFTGRSGSR